MRFLYGQNGLVGFIIDGITYTYRKNLFGDIIGIFSGNTEMATYVYDAWGNCTITKSTNGLGTLNPFRYRGYYWDSNLGLYYLISRYYDPQTGRFINSDTLDYLDPQTLGGLNLYAYCGNNPVNYCDPSGHNADSILKKVLGIITCIGLAVATVVAVVASGGTLIAPVVVSAGVGAGLNLVGQGVTNLSQNKGFFDGVNWWNVVLGGLSGAAFATGIGGLWGAVTIGAVSNAGMSAFDGNSWANIGFSAFVGGVAAFTGYKLGKHVSNKLLNINTNLGFGNYLNMARVDGAGFFSRSVVALLSKLYTMGPTFATGISRGVMNFIGNHVGDQF